MVKYIIDAQDVADYSIAKVEINTVKRVVEVRLVRRHYGAPPIRAMVRYAPVAYEYCVPTTTVWVESSANGVEYVLGTPAETIISATIARLFLPIIKLKLGKEVMRHVVGSIQHGN